MSFGAPLVLLALATLPALWWLLRVTPPAPRSQSFPAIRLLEGLRAREETAARTPLWLLLLRMAAAALLIVGLARPVLDAAGGLPGRGTLLLVIDDGWAAAADWGARAQAAAAVLDRAAQAGRRVVLLTTARSEEDAAPVASAASPAPELRARLAALRPKPWPVSRELAAAAIRGVHAGGAVWIGDGVGTPGDEGFLASLGAVGPVEVVRAGVRRALLMRPPEARPDRLVARLAALPVAAAQPFAVLAQTGDGRTLARAEGVVAPGADTAEVGIAMPPELRNRLARLTLAGVASAGAVALLDEGSRRRPVGLVAAEQGTDTPLLGALYYVRRALDAGADLHEGPLAALLRQNLSVIVEADQPMSPVDAAALRGWVEKGGLLVRFAGPRLAEGGGDGLLPVPLLAGDRQLGGALSWTTPAHLAPFGAESPFAGLAAAPDVTVSRQVLAEPSAALAGRSWATLADGTPLVTAAPMGAGRVVLFHVTANADWSNLPLSGLFPAMLKRLVALSAGVATPPGRALLAPSESLDGFGQAGVPPAAAAALEADRAGATVPGPRHPPGLYGPESGPVALNLGSAVAAPVAAGVPTGARLQTLGGDARERPLAGSLIAAALALLVADLLVSLRLRGLLRAAAVLVLLALPAWSAEPADFAALVTRLGYVETGDGAVDAVSEAGLAGLSAYVNERTAAVLGPPAGVRPGQDDLSFYPLLYWPLVADAAMPAAGVAALNDFMARGGVLLVDTRGAGSGEGFAPGAATALRRVAGPGGLSVPPLTPLTSGNVLAHSFYLLREFPGRFVGGAVWIGRDRDPGNDGVSPVIIGGNDWAAAWATDASGGHPFATIPGGDRQRELAYRFGVNLVMYALTGNYKGDQVHVPAILQRLGQ